MEHKKRLIGNFISLVIMQGTNYILPLITLPYLVRVLGPEKYGLIAFSQSFMQYFGLLTDYGFNLSATRLISINRENKREMSNIFSTVMTIKFIFLGSSFLLLLVSLISFKKFQEDWLIYILSYGSVIGTTIFPVWFFQGIEKLKYISILNILIRVLSTVPIFIFIHSSNDTIKVALFNSVGFIIVGIIGLVIVYRRFEISYIVPNVRDIKFHLKEGWHVFVSTLSISLYTMSNTFILGIFTNNTVVGYYASGEKIIKAIQGLLQPLTQTIYPHINNLVNKSEQIAINFLKKIYLIVGCITLFESLVLFLFADKIVFIIIGDLYKNSVVVLKILAFLPFVVAMSNIFGTQTMLPFNHKKAFSKILITAGIANIILALILIPEYKHIGTAISVMTTEAAISISMAIYSIKYIINNNVAEVSHV